MTAAAGWAGRRTLIEWLGLSAGLAVFAYVGWDGALWDARFQLLLHLIAIGAIAGLGLVAVRGGAVPHTPIDLPLVALLVAFGLATVSAMNIGMSLRAMASIAAYAAMLPVALICIRHRPSWVGVLTSVPVLVLSVPTLVALVARRVEWVLVGAPGLPPIRLPGEGTPFGSVAVPPFVIWPAWALAGLIESPRWRGIVRGGLVIVGVPLTILSGSRSAWLAMGVTIVAAAIPWLWRNRHRLRPSGGPTARTIALALVAVAGIVAAIALIAPRLTAVTSLIYRAGLWADTLAAWSTDPLLGIGPGVMPYARQAAAPDFSFPVGQPHSHNLPLGVLGDAGLVGLAAAVVLVVAIAWYAGPWRSRTGTGRAASFLLLGLAVGGLFEDLTFVPAYNLLAIVLLAVALTDAGVVEWRPIQRRRVLLPAGAVALVLVGGMVVADAGAISYRMGTDAAANGDWDGATDLLRRSVEIDPWQPTGPKSLAVSADWAGRSGEAREAAEAAVQLNPGEAPSWVNLALTCAEAADSGCQANATERAVARAGFLEAELLNAAISYESLRMAPEADDAYRRSLLSQSLTAFAHDWPRTVPIGAATADEDAILEFNRLLAWWAMDEPIDVASISDPATRALAHAMRDERAEAEEWMERAIDVAPDSNVTWDVVVVVRDHWGLPVDDEIAIASVVRGSPFPNRSAPVRVPGQIFDIASFRAYPADGLVADAQRLGTDPPYPWILQRTLP